MSASPPPPRRRRGSRFRVTEQNAARPASSSPPIEQKLRRARLLVVLDSRRTVVDEAHAQLVRRQAPVTGHARKGFAGLEGGDESASRTQYAPWALYLKTLTNFADAQSAPRDLEARRAARSRPTSHCRRRRVAVLRPRLRPARVEPPARQDVRPALSIRGSAPSAHPPLIATARNTRRIYRAAFVRDRRRRGRRCG